MNSIAEKETVTPSSGNVFADFGLDNADELMAKAKLALAIRNWIEERGLTPAQAADILRTTPERLSDLYSSKALTLTYDRLLGFLNALDCDVAITVTSRPQENAARRGKTLVAAE